MTDRTLRIEQKQSGTPVGTGLYGLAHMDGTRPGPDDLRALGLPIAAPEPSSTVCATVVDAENLAAADTATDGADWCWFLGEIEDTDTLAATLSCEPTPGAIALAAMQKWGAQTGDQLKGVWSLVYWDDHNRALWLGSSPMARDRIYYAHDPERVAISGDLLRLTSVSWVGAAHDPSGIAYGLSNARLRRQRAGRMVFAGIFELEPGTFHRFAAGGMHDQFRHGPDVPIIVHASFDEAVARLDERLRTVIAATMSRHQRVAVTLSGGLDSAIVARFVAEMCKPGQQVVALTAAAPPSSSVPDECHLAAAVAAAFGIEHQLVWPSDSAGIFRPGPDHFADGRPNLSPRHYLDDAMDKAAREFGATAVFDGVGGEMSVSTSREPATFLQWLRKLKRWVIEMRDYRPGDEARANDTGLVALAPHLLALLPTPLPIESAARRAFPTFWPANPKAPTGLLPGYEKAWRCHPSGTGGNLRHYSPLCDRELVLMVGGMPGGYTSWQERDRALARALLQGHVPDHVTYQPKGLGYSVDYDQRFQAELPQILPRFAAWRAACVQEWLDLDWLEREVRRLMALDAIPVDAQFPVQLTALAAEYFLYCHESGIVARSS